MSAVSKTINKIFRVRTVPFNSRWSPYKTRVGVDGRQQYLGSWVRLTLRIKLNALRAHRPA